MNPCPLGSRILDDLVSKNSKARREIETRSNLGVQFGHSYTNRGTANRTVDCEFIRDPVSLIDWNRKSDPLISTASGCDCGTDGDHFSIEINERTARVARVDRCIGLNQTPPIDPRDGSVFGANDTGTDGCFQPKRATDCKHPITDFQQIRVCDFCVLKRLFANKFQGSDIAIGITTYFSRFNLRVISELDNNSLSTRDHMIIGDHAPVRRDDDTTTHSG